MKNISPKRCSILELLAQDILTKKTFTITLADSLESAVSLMSTHEIRHLPVVDCDKVIGMLSDRDVREALPSFSEIMAQPDVARTRFSAPLSLIVRLGVATIPPTATIPEIIDVLVEQKIGAVPVVRPRTGELEGIVSYVDVLTALRRQYKEDRKRSRRRG
jgi:acetoin utilization protein AcuB